MTKRFCPYCAFKICASGSWRNFKRSGHFRRKSDGKRIQIFRCLTCSKYFSSALFNRNYRQKKRNINHILFVDYSSSTSLRRSAINLRISRTTAARKLKLLGEQAERELRSRNESLEPAGFVQFDDLETFEHTKCKPLSVTLVLEKGTRRILDFEISRMAAKGTLAMRSVKKYGLRRDERSSARRKLFKRVRPLISPTATIESDQNPYYPKDVMRFFPRARHISHLGQRGSTTGQGELKKVRFDPLFSLNHTCAMLRDNIKRLGRKTWCTTKKPEALRASIAIYALYHNSLLIARPTS